MCGIAACIKKHGVIDRTKFEAMTDIVKHRGPDDRGFFYENNLALGHRRLAIIDLTKDGHQPFEMIDGFVLVFNGEIYNYLELRAELTKRGHHFQTQTDTEVIVHAYKEWGNECVNHFNGMWAFVLYDKRRKTLFCSRDRFGVKPFYYTEQEGMFLVASEIKQFFELLEDHPTANRDALMRYIIRGTIDCPPETLFQSIYQLEPGYNLTYDLERYSYKKCRYYNIGDMEEKSQTYEDACVLFRESFAQSVKLRLRSDVPLGYFLSGGLDSSAIVCMANREIKKAEQSNTHKEQHTISACFEEKEYNEQEYIDEVIRVADIIPHKIFPGEGSLWEELDKIIWHMDEPLGGTTTYAQWSVCKAAKQQGLTVMLDGQGADEQLAGYTDFYTVMFLYALKKGKWKLFKEEVDAYLALRAGTEQHVSSRNVIVTAIKDFLTPQCLERYIKQVYLTKVAKIPFDKSVIRNVLKKERIYPKRDPREYIKTYMENELVALLHREDRNGMAFSLESRTPFLDYRLVNSVFSMAFEYKIRKGYTKAVLRDGLSGILPEKVAKRTSKFGFVTPEDKWINENKEFYRMEFIKALEVFHDLFDTDKVLRWFDASQGTVKRGDSFVWRIIDSSRWVKLFQISV